MVFASYDNDCAGTSYSQCLQLISRSMTKGCLLKEPEDHELFFDTKRALYSNRPCESSVTSKKWIIGLDTHVAESFLLVAILAQLNNGE